MKKYSHYFIAIGLTLSVAMASFGQADTVAVNKTWANWILASIDYAEKNYTIMPRQFTSVLFRQYSNSSVNGNESFNSSIFKFLKTNYRDNLKQGKFYFVQSYNPSACSFYDNANYSIVLDTNQSIRIHKSLYGNFSWKRSLVTNIDFKDFKTKFEEYSDFYNLSEVDGLLPNYYIITEFNKGNVRVKTLFAHL